MSSKRPRHGSWIADIVRDFGVKLHNGNDSEEFVRQLVRSSVRQFHENYGYKFEKTAAPEGAIDATSTYWKEKKIQVINDEILTQNIFRAATSTMKASTKDERMRKLLSLLMHAWSHEKGLLVAAGKKVKHEFPESEDDQTITAAQSITTRSRQMTSAHASEATTINDTGRSDTDRPDQDAPQHQNLTQFVVLNRMQDIANPLEYTLLGQITPLQSICMADSDEPDLDKILELFRTKSGLHFDQIDDRLVFPGCTGVPAVIIKSANSLAKLWKAAKELGNQPFHRIDLVDLYIARGVIDRLNVQYGYPTPESARDASDAICNSEE